MLPRILLCALFFPLSVLADTKLVQTCSGTLEGSVCSQESFVRPTANSVVRISNPVSWRPFGTLAATKMVRVCNADVPVGSATCPAIVDVPLAEVQTGSTPPPVTSRNIKLTFTVPTQNTNGTPLTNIKGYWVYSAVANGAFGQVRFYTSPVAQPILLTGFAPGNYQLTMTTVNTSDIESIQAPPIPVTVPPPGTPDPVVPNCPSGLAVELE